MKLTVNVREFGAVCNGTLQTKAIQDAIDHCFLAGGGEVQIPEGVFLTGGIRLRSRVTLHLLENAVLKGSRDPEDYFGYRTDTVEPLRDDQITDCPWRRMKDATCYDPNDTRYAYRRIDGSRWFNALIRVIDAQDVAIIGESGSRIDGSNCYDELGEEHYRGPHAVTMHRANNVTLRGYTIVDSANWAHNIKDCDNVLVEGITVLGGHDGINVWNCHNVTIRNSEFYTGDDCVAGYGSANLLVSDCVLNSACSAMRFGATNALIQRCHIFAPCRYFFRGSLSLEEKRDGTILAEQPAHRNNMLSVFTYYADYALPIPYVPGNIIVQDCKIEQADRFLHYNFSGNEIWQKGRPLDSIIFRNIQATGIAMPLTAYGAEDAKVSVTLSNISIRMRDGIAPTPLIRACHFRRIELENVDVTNFNGDCLLLSRSDDEAVFRNVTCDGLEEKDFVRLTDEEFVIKPI